MFNRGVLRLGKGGTKWIFLSSIMLLTGGAAYIVEIMLISGFIGKIGTFSPDGGDKLAGALSGLLPALAGILAVKAASSRLDSYFSYRVTVKLKYLIREKIFDKIRRLGPGYADNSGTAELITNSIDGVEALEVFFGRFISQLIYSLIIPIILFIVTFPIYSLFSLVLLAAVPVIPLSMVFISKRAAGTMNNFWDDYQGLSSLFLENLQGIVTLKLFNKSEERMRDMESRAWGFRNSTMELLRMQLSSISVMDTLVYGFAGLGVFLAIRGLYMEKINLEGFFILLMLSVEFFLPIRKLGSLFHAGVNGIQAAGKIVSFLDSAEDVKEPENGRAPSGSDLVFENVTFSYSPDLPDILNNLSYRFPSGGVYGIAGVSGCGKSTFGRMVLRFHDPDAGAIKFGGVPLTEISLAELRRRITLVESRSSIFDGTIESNLRLAKPDATTEEMMDACRSAGLCNETGSTVLTGDPADLKKQTGEGGAMLSGGERQRLAIARTILLDPDVFVFDEASGSVDAESEEIIKRTILNLPADKTVFIISHRSSMFEGVDRCLAIRDGKFIDETGSRIKADCAAGAVG